MKKGVKFDYKQAYNKNLKPSARLHYLENARHDQDSPAKKYGSPMKMGSHSIHKHMGGSALLNYSEARDLEEDMPVDKDATGGRSTANSKIQAGKKLKQEGRAQKKSERKVKSLDRKAKRAERAEASGNTKKADRLKRSAQRKKDRIARKNK
jgi:hypothetical protein